MTPLFRSMGFRPSRHGPSSRRHNCLAFCNGPAWCLCHHDTFVRFFIEHDVERPSLCENRHTQADEHNCCNQIFRHRWFSLRETGLSHDLKNKLMGKSETTSSGLPMRAIRTSMMRSDPNGEEAPMVTGGTPGLMVGLLPVHWGDQRWEREFPSL